MGKPSKHSDAVWDAAFEREKAGERRADLAVELGVGISTMNWQANKRGLKRGVTPGWVDHRRRPEGGWPADHVFAQSRSGMTPKRWDALLDRYVDGEAIEALATEHGVAEATIARQAAEQKKRKRDRPEAVYRPRGPTAAAAGCGAASAGRAAMAFDYDPDNPEVGARALAVLETAAAREGRASDFLTLRRIRRAAGLHAVKRSEPRPEMAFDLHPRNPRKTFESLMQTMLRATIEERDDDFDALEGLFKQLQEVFLMMELPWDPEADAAEAEAEAEATTPDGASRAGEGPC